MIRPACCSDPHGFDCFKRFCHAVRIPYPPFGGSDITTNHFKINNCHIIRPLLACHDFRHPGQNQVSHTGGETIVDIHHNSVHRVPLTLGWWLSWLCRYFLELYESLRQRKGWSYRFHTNTTVEYRLFHQNFLCRLSLRQCSEIKEQNFIYVFDIQARCNT